ncbi:AraC family transcriptional regulator [Streptomyces sp. NPDC004031]
MDVLSDVVAAARTGRPRSSLVRCSAPWAREFGPGPDTVSVHVVLHGACVLRVDAADGSAASAVPDGEALTAVAAYDGPRTAGHPPPAPGSWPVRAPAGARAGPGDVLLVPHGADHLLTDPLGGPDAPRHLSPGGAARPAVRGGAVPPAHLRPGGHVPGPRGAERTPPDPAPGDGPASVLLSGGYRLDPRYVHPLLHELPAVLHLPASPARHPDVTAAVRLLAGELDRPRLGTDALIPPLLDALLLYALRAWFADRPGPDTAEPGWGAALTDPPVAAALRAMHRAPDAPWTVERLAREAGLSRAAFARRFASLTGRPPLAYLTWWRMTLAARLLAESSLPLAGVAARVGYSSEFAFAHAFKRWYGVAPGRHRRTTQAAAASHRPVHAPTARR